MPVRLEPAAPRSGVKLSTTEPLRSPLCLSFPRKSVVRLSDRLNKIIAGKLNHKSNKQKPPIKQIRHICLSSPDELEKPKLGKMD